MIIARGIVRRRSASVASEIMRWHRMGLFDAKLNGKLIEEIARTLRNLGVGTDKTRDSVNWLCQRDVVVPIKHQRMGCMDPDDDHLFETAFVSHARMIVSIDANVLAPPAALRAWLVKHDVRVVGEAAFCQFMRERVFSPLAPAELAACGLACQAGRR